MELLLLVWVGGIAPSPPIDATAFFALVASGAELFRRCNSISWVALAIAARFGT